MKTYTRNELTKMTQDELSKLQKELGRHIDTQNETKARLLNHAILDENNRRNGYGQ